METVKGKNVLIIGATGGIGVELCKLLQTSGANIFITGRNIDKLNTLSAELKLPDNRKLVVDLNNESSMAALQEKYFAAMPGLDIYINAAGIGIIKNTDNLTATDFTQTLQANLVASFLLLKQFLPYFKEQKKGLIVHIPGILGKVPMTGAAAYSASKYGLVGMLQSIREEFKRTDVRFTNLFLGGVNSPFWDNIDLKVQRDKMITAAEAAKAIWFLCQQPASGVVSEMVLQPFNHQAI
jgi:short-subunit dehydrogenase